MFWVWSSCHDCLKIDFLWIKCYIHIICRNCYKIDRYANCNEGEPYTVDLKSACA